MKKDKKRKHGEHEQGQGGAYEGTDKIGACDDHDKKKKKKKVLKDVGSIESESVHHDAVEIQLEVGDRSGDIDKREREMREKKRKKGKKGKGEGKKGESL